MSQNVTKFSQKVQVYIDVYAGDIKEAADKAGLTYQYARQVHLRADVIEAIRNRQDTEIRPATVADRQERQVYWTAVMRGEATVTVLVKVGEDMIPIEVPVSIKDRLRASELLGKSECDFSEKKVIDGSLSLEEIIAVSFEE